MQLQADCWMAVFASRWGLVNVNIGLALLLGSSWPCAASLCVCVCVRVLSDALRGKRHGCPRVVCQPFFFQRTADFYWVSAMDRPHGGPGSLF